MTRIGTYMNLKINFYFSYFHLNFNQHLIFNFRYKCNNYRTDFMVVKYSFFPSLQQWTLSEIMLIGFKTGIPLSRVYIRERSWDPQFFDLKNNVMFIVAGHCAHNVQRLKEIHAWAYLELSQRTTKPTITYATSEDSDQTAHLRSLIRVFAGHMCLLQPQGYPNWVDVQAYLRLCCSQRSYVGFVVRWLKCCQLETYIKNT